MTSKVAFCLSPYHLAQALAFYDGQSEMTVLTRHMEVYRHLLGEFPGLRLLSIDDRAALLRELKRARKPFDFYYATFWNRTALRMEKLALELGGRVHIFEDGIGGFGRPWPWHWRKVLSRIVFAILDGTRHADYIVNKAFDPQRTFLYSAMPSLALPESAAKNLKVLPIDFSAFRAMLPRIARHFEHLKPYRGMPAFFDTNDCEGDWYPFKQKVEILRDVLPQEPLLYFPHPNQRFRATDHFPQLIDMTGKTHHWNEMACYYIDPSAIYSVFSTAAFALRHIYQLKFLNVLLFEEFHERTGHAGFSAEYISPSMKALLDYAGDGEPAAGSERDGLGRQSR